MKKRIEMDRRYVNDAPVVVFTAANPCMVSMWCLPNLELEEDEPAEFSHVFVSTNRELCTVSDAMPLPEDHPVEVPLAAGETLYAVTADMAYMGYVAYLEE
jgi:hypothetical protein